MATKVFNFICITRELLKFILLITGGPILFFWHFTEARIVLGNNFQFIGTLQIPNISTYLIARSSQVGTCSYYLRKSLLLTV